MSGLKLSCRQAAEAKKAPAFIQTSMGAANTWVVTKHVCPYWKPCRINGYYCTSCYSPDHGHYDDALECIEAGYTSIMFDGLHSPVEENQIGWRCLKSLYAKAHLSSWSWYYRWWRRRKYRWRWIKHQSKTPSKWFSLQESTLAAVSVTSTSLPKLERSSLWPLVKLTEAVHRIPIACTVIRYPWWSNPSSYQTGVAKLTWTLNAKRICKCYSSIRNVNMMQKREALTWQEETFDPRKFWNQVSKQLL